MSTTPHHHFSTRADVQICADTAPRYAVTQGKEA
jgi:hypothetical protein